MAYLCNKHGLEHFYPADPGERAMLDSAMFYLIGTLYPLVARATYPTLGFPQYPGEVGSSDADAAMKARRSRRPRPALAEPLDVYRASSSPASGSSAAPARRSPTSALPRRSSSCARRLRLPGWAKEYMAAWSDARRRLHGAGGRRARLHRVREVAEPGVSATSPEQITEGVVRRYDACPDPRLRQIMQSLRRPPPRLHHRGRADARRVDRRDPDPDRDRRDHRRAAARSSSSGRTRWACRCSSTRSPPIRCRRVRPSRPSSARSTSPGSPLREYGEGMAEKDSAGHPGLGARARALVPSTARRSPARSSTSGRTTPTCLYAVQKARRAPRTHLRGRYITRDPTAASRS